MTPEETNTSPIYILGDTPTAYLLATKLTLAGENVCLLNEQGNNKPLAFTVKDSAAQKTVIPLHIRHIMHHPAKMVLLCLATDKIKAGLSYFSGAKTLNCPIISFCRTADTSLINTSINRVIIQAYFDGWLQMATTNALTFLGAPRGITVSLDEDHPYFDLVQNTLAKTYLKLAFYPDDTENFWNDFIFFAANALFSLEHGARLRDISKNSTLRQSLNDIADELLSLVPEKIKIDKEQILNDIYLTPIGYKMPILDAVHKAKCGELNFIFDTIARQPTYQASAQPLITKIIGRTLKQILSSVEE